MRGRESVETNRGDSKKAEIVKNEQPLAFNDTVDLEKTAEAEPNGNLSRTEVALTSALAERNPSAIERRRKSSGWFRSNE